jgi:hypothetical protein
MKLFIPAIGTKLKLTQDWIFDLHFEYRNEKFVETLNISPPPNLKYWEYSGKIGGKVCVKQDSILSINRIYIRLGQRDFDSITFYLSGIANGKAIKRARFWVKLEDANKIEYEVVN